MDDDRRYRDDSRRALNPGNSSSSNGGLGSNGDNSGFIRSQKLETREMIELQDRNLENLGQAVDRLGAIASTVDEELRVQSDLLDRLDDDVEHASGNLSRAQIMLTALLNSSDGCQMWTIIGLSVTLVLLIVLIIWS